MTKTKQVQVRWIGTPGDPDSMTQNGITYKKGEWTSVPDDSDDVRDVNGRPQKPLIYRLRDNPQFEVKGMDAKDQAVTVDTANPAQTGAPVRASLVTYKPVAVTDAKGKTTGWKIEGKNPVTQANVPGPTDEYADEASAQVVCDGLNQVAP